MAEIFLKNMKLTRTEKQRENEILDLFLSFAPAYLKKLEKGKPADLTEPQRASFAVAFQFLEREINNRAEKGRKKAVKDEEIDKVIAALNEKTLTPEAAIAKLGISLATLYRYWNKKNTAPATDYKTTPDITFQEIRIFRKIGEGKDGEVSPTEIENLKRGLKIIKQHREVAKVRGKNLTEGREKLEKTFDQVKSRPKAVKLIREQKRKSES